RRCCPTSTIGSTACPIRASKPCASIRRRTFGGRSSPPFSPARARATVLTSNAKPVKPPGTWESCAARPPRIRALTDNPPSSKKQRDRVGTCFLRQGHRLQKLLHDDASRPDPLDPDL